ncbi:MAG: hypothetical protein LH702_29100, partial [Phormidesmis sp. CAN_BIN44]|nr:hypothetical protein [Phormidesmis sp. CAN_BIN44]
KIPIPGSSTNAQSQPSNLSGSGNLGSAFSGTMQQFGLPAGGSTGDSTEASATSANNRSPQAPYGFTSNAPATLIEGTTSLGGFGVNAAPTTNPYTNSYTSLVEGTQPLSATAALRVVAPSIAPISPSLGQSYLSPQPLNPSGLNAAPSSLMPQQPQIPINDAPFTAPRPIPGRVLGGGEINTFSNP